jgi:multidrug transporter EmrE-like cation transporter
MMAYGLLALAIVSEVTGSTFLVKSEGFTKLGPSVASFFNYRYKVAATCVAAVGILFCAFGLKLASATL